MPQYNQSSSNINILYDIIEYKANVKGLTCSIHQLLNDSIFETAKIFCEYGLTKSYPLSYNNIFDKSNQSKVNNNGRIMTVTVYYSSIGYL